MGKEIDIFEVFFRRKPAMILVALRNNPKARYGSVLAKEVDCTYSHAVKILQEMENAKTPFRQSTTCLVTRRGQLSEGSVAGHAVHSSVRRKGIAENSVARATAERVRGGQCLEAYHDFNTRATPPQGPPRAEKGASSQIS